MKVPNKAYIRCLATNRRRLYFTSSNRINYVDVFCMLLLIKARDFLKFIF